MAAPAAEAAPVLVHLRFEWGGGARRTWQGEVQVDRGTFSDLQPLGIEADEPGAMWIDKQSVRIAHRSGRTYDAFDVQLLAEPDAELKIKLGDAELGDAKEWELPVAQVVADVFSGELDGEGNRLLVRRAPGDRLRIAMQRDALVFDDSETFSFRLLPQLPEVPAGKQLRFVARLTPARGATVLWSRDYDVKAPGVGETPPEMAFDVPLPAEEGAYDIHLLAYERSFRQRLVNVVLPKPIAERTVQVVVVARQPTPAARATASDWRSVGEINPANPGWWKRWAQMPTLTLIPGWPQGPLRSGDVAPQDHALGAMVRFAEQATPEDTTWEAYPLPIESVGAPHLLEVEYPSDQPQHLGVSIVEPSASGTVLPIGLDSGFYTSSDAARGEPQLVRHQLLFWPKTKTPMVLLVQRSGRTPAVFRKLRVLAGPRRLPRATPAARGEENRLVAGYFDRPLFPENFSTTGVVDEWSGQTIDDWETFYQGGARLVDYLNYAGYNGLMLNVWGDGSTIYPSARLQSTPRYDTGQLGASGGDPRRKDALEMVLRMFDREQLRLIPTLQFAAPLPELEAIRRRGGPEAVGLELIGADGGTWLAQNPPERALAPYYNPLNETVQQAMLRVVREAAERYGKHAAFAGLGLQLSAETYTQLPGADWGFDDDTIARFEAASGVRTPPGAGPDRFRRRAEFLLGPQRPTWLAWRARAMANFYGRLQREVARVRPDAKLYLVGGGMFNGPLAQHALRPALPQAAKFEPLLLDLGLQPQLWADNPQLELVRPQRIGPPEPLHARGVDLQINASTELDQQRAAAASLFYHPRQRMRLRSFEQQSPFGEANTYALLVAQPVPSGAFNRQRFAQALAQRDAAEFFDGGWLLPMGQEEATRRMFAVLRQLPRGFETSPASKQPITVRTLVEGQNTLVYLVNESPWTVAVTVKFNATGECVLAEFTESGLAPGKPLADGAWSITLPPFDLAAARVAQPNATVKKLEFQLDDAIELALNARIEELGARAAALAALPEFAALANPGFEDAGPAGELRGWSLVSTQGVVAKSDEQKPYSGKSALRLESTRQVASLQSDLFAVPATGRLAVKVWVRAEASPRQPVLRLALEGPHDGKSYYRYAPVGGSGPGVVPMQAEWTSYIFQVDDLPAAGFEQMRVRFDLMGPGVVWIDEVQLYHLKFDKNERVELSKILESARRALNSGELADCVRLLQGYWPQFLDQHVEPTAAPLARQAALPRRPAPPPAEKPAPGALDRLRNAVPRWPF